MSLQLFLNMGKSGVHPEHFNRKLLNHQLSKVIIKRYHLKMISFSFITLLILFMPTFSGGVDEIMREMLT